jgi:hypothetical protein
MRSTTDHVHAGHDQSAPPPTDARGPDGPMYAPPEPEASCEAIERCPVRPHRRAYAPEPGPLGDAWDG